MAGDDDKLGAAKVIEESARSSDVGVVILDVVGIDHLQNVWKVGTWYSREEEGRWEVRVAFVESTDVWDVVANEEVEEFLRLLLEADKLPWNHAERRRLLD